MTFKVGDIVTVVAHAEGFPHAVWSKEEIEEFPIGTRARITDIDDDGSIFAMRLDCSLDVWAVSPESFRLTTPQELIEEKLQEIHQLSLGTGGEVQVSVHYYNTKTQEANSKMTGDLQFAYGVVMGIISKNPELCDGVMHGINQVLRVHKAKKSNIIIPPRIIQ